MPERADGSANQENILFVRLRLLGDIIFTIPALQMFKAQRPQYRVHYVVEDRFRELAELIPAVDNVIAVARRPGWRDFWNFRKTAKGLGVGTTVDFHCGPTSALFTLASGAVTRVGYRTINRNWAYSDMIPRNADPVPVHSVVKQARLLAKIGIDASEPPPYPPIDVSHFPANRRLQELGLSGPRVVIHVGAGNSFRDWGMENFSSLIARLSQRKIPVLLIGHSEEEKKRSVRLSHLPHVFDFSGPLPVRELLQLIAGASVYLGADSGPLHLASLTSTPLVGIYGPNLPQISGPWRKENVEILELEMPCRPCSQRKCEYATIRCMRNIAVEKVLNALDPFLK